MISKKNPATDSSFFLRESMRCLILFCVLAFSYSCPASEHYSSVPEVEFAIQAEASVGTLNDCVMLWGYGWIKPVDNSSRLHWQGKAPVNRYAVTPVGFRFVPASNGWAVLSIKAPADKNTNDSFGLDVRNISAMGTQILPDDTEQRFRLTSGVPVVMQFTALMTARPGYEQMPRLPARGTPAHKAIGYFQRGVSLGNYLEAPPDEDWGASYSLSDYDAIKSEGFDHVRVPCAWQHYMGSPPDFTICPAFFDRVDAMVSPALDRGLAVIINWHHFDAFTDDPEKHMEQFIKGWKQISRRYASAPGRIAFELLNEPKDAADTLVMNNVYAEAISALRREAPDNTLFVGPGQWNHATELVKLMLPHAESNIIVTIHDYDPFLFTHQGASWTAPLTDIADIVFPGPPTVPVSPSDYLKTGAGWAIRWFEAYNILPSEWNPASDSALGYNLRLAAAWSEYYGRPVHVGEWGCIIKADADSRRRYYAAMIRILRETRLAWAIWDWNAHFRYWNQDEQAPMPGMREALR